MKRSTDLPDDDPRPMVSDSGGVSGLIVGDGVLSLDVICSDYRRTYKSE